MTYEVRCQRNSCVPALTGVEAAYKATLRWGHLASALSYLSITWLGKYVYENTWHLSRTQSFLLRHLSLNLIPLDMSIRLRQTRGNVVAADDTNVAGLNQVWPRQFHLSR